MLTDADGTYAVSHVGPSTAARKITINPTCQLVANSKNVNVAWRGIYTVDVPLPLGATSGSIAGTVSDDSNSGLGWVSVTLAAPGQPTRSALTDASGHFSFSGVSLGVSALTLFKKSYDLTTINVSLTCDKPTRDLTVMLR